MTFTIHCTKKLLDRVKRPVSTEQIEPTTFLGNWYATALFWKPQVALLINERTLLPVLMPLAPAAELALRFPVHLASVLIAHGAPHALVERELTAMLDFQYAKTSNRSLLAKRREVEQPLNARLFLETFLLDYQSLQPRRLSRTLKLTETLLLLMAVSIFQ